MAEGEVVSEMMLNQLLVHKPIEADQRMTHVEASWPDHNLQEGSVNIASCKSCNWKPWIMCGIKHLRVVQYDYLQLLS